MSTSRSRSRRSREPTSVQSTKVRKKIYSIPGMKKSFSELSPPLAPSGGGGDTMYNVL